MTQDARKKQKKIMKRNAARKAKKKEMRTQQQQFTPKTFLSNATDYPIHKCIWQESLFADQMGIGLVAISRKVGSDLYLIGGFMVDMYCLGIKDTMLKLVDEVDAAKILNPKVESYPTRQVEPACAVKLITNAVEYARSIGFEPYHNYEEIAQIFEDIDPSECSKEFTFGREGKPFYISSPFDSKRRITTILKTLEENLGEGNFYFTGKSDDI